MVTYKQQERKAESQENSSFPVDGHQAILIKMNKIDKDKQKADEHWLNHNRSTALERSVIN